jgi:hypothetical protein
MSLVGMERIVQFTLVPSTSSTRERRLTGKADRVVVAAKISLDHVSFPGPLLSHHPTAEVTQQLSYLHEGAARTSLLTKRVRSYPPCHLLPSLFLSSTNLQTQFCAAVCCDIRYTPAKVGLKPKLKLFRLPSQRSPPTLMTMQREAQGSIDSFMHASAHTYLCTCRY